MSLHKPETFARFPKLANDLKGCSVCWGTLSASLWSVLDQPKTSVPGSFLLLCNNNFTTIFCASLQLC
jgi:hypothetical protein